MSTKSGQFVYLDDGTVAQQVQIAGTDSQSTGALGVNVKQSDAIVPVDIQNRLASTIQLLSGSVLAPSASTSSPWIDCDGFDKLSLLLKNDASTTSSITIFWSVDGSTLCGDEAIFGAATNMRRAATTDIKARYAQFYVTNGDGAAAHTMSAWTYLRA